MVIQFKNNKTTKEIGTKYETIASQYLAKHNIQIISKNFSCKVGEIDLIGIDQDNIVFIEVRYRKNLNYGSPLETIVYKKQQKIIKTAQYFMLTNEYLYNRYSPRFDIIGIWHEKSDLKIEWAQSAF